MADAAAIAGGDAGPRPHGSAARARRRSMAALLALIAPLRQHLSRVPDEGLCFALFACAFNLLLGFGGLLSFGHAMFLGTAALRLRA